MNASRDELKTRIKRILEQHLSLDEAPELACNMLIEIFFSTLTAAKENRIGRPLEVEKAKANKQLRDIVQLLKKAEGALSGLNPLARELIARNQDGLLDLSNGELEQFIWSGAQLGSSHAANDFTEQVAAIRHSIERVSAELEGKVQTFGRGAPRKDGALAVAQLCSQAFKEYVGEPAHPTWNDYSNKTEGRFYSFTKDVFDAGGLDASPEEFVKQAIELKQKINSGKR
ncbi:hypothetical protein [Antarctobacter jejuensis]|uniref:hypothetical protein n=1 Tax=Antarctobacter jejuensis TaxID=1439938 RepID=UPI003FD172E9